MQKLREYEKLLAKNAKAKNTLESFIYKVNDLKLDDEFKMYINETD